VPRRAGVGVCVALLLLIGTVPTAGAGTTASPELTWRGCRDGLECATLEVPVDYSVPDGEQVGIAIIRRAATDSENRIGSLIVNYGGPGDPGTETFRLAHQSLPEVVRERFDLVSFDPRGTGRSRPIDCIDDRTFDDAWTEDVTPDDESELPSFYDGTAFSIDLFGECVARQGDWLAHVGTRNVARDLDRLRVALGDDKLTYLGYSYGTVIGAVYAQEHPDRVRALVLDSAVNLSTTAEQRQRGNARGFERTLDRFLDDCAADSECSYHSDGHPREALLQLRDELEGGVRIDGADGRSVGITELYVAMLAALYQEETWPTLAEALRAADHESDGALLQRLSDLYAGRREDGTYTNIQEAISVINCADQPLERVTFEEFAARFDDFVDRYPIFGRAFAGSPLGCDPRLPAPSPEERLGDVRTTEAPAVLVVVVTDDPVTPAAGSIDLRKRLAGSRLLTLDATRHAAYGFGVACIDDAVNDYLVTLELPRPKTVCEG
jgi:pimeloyl-ACP methyl ester carboxylesterase